jgi:hypothetical protein
MQHLPGINKETEFLWGFEVQVVIQSSINFRFFSFHIALIIFKVKYIDEEFNVNLPA